MKAGEDQIKLAAQLYNCRDVARALFQSEYHNKVKVFIESIQNNMKTLGKGALETTAILAKNERGIKMMLYFAAYVEMTEPSK